MKIIFLFQFLLLLFVNSFAQKGTASISNIEKKGDIVEITITCSEHLYTGANPYVLYIDDQAFRRSQEPRNGEGRALVFYVPATKFSELTNGSVATMVYGLNSKNARSKNTEGKTFTGKYWQLGKLNKTMLDK